MLKKLLSPQGIWQENAIAVLRVIIAAFMIIHGIEVFDDGKMSDYAKWFSTDLKMESALSRAYLGKVVELIAGVLLMVGLFTRFAAVILAVVMVFITFKIGHGKFYMEDQHPFMFVLFAFLFFFSGGGKWSLDNFFFGRSKL